MTARRAKRMSWIVLVSMACWAAGCGSRGDAPAGAPSAAGGQVASQDDLHPRVLIKTSLGEITARLDAEHAPLTVENFLGYAADGYYAGTIFHQVEAGFIALGGGYTPDLLEKPVRVPVRNEAANGLKNRRGTLAMFRRPDVIDSATSQFFINLADNPTLDHKESAPLPYFWTPAAGDAPPPAGSESADNGRAGQYGYCVFGEIVSGQDVLDQLSKAEVHSVGAFDKVAVKPITILGVTRIK